MPSWYEFYWESQYRSLEIRRQVRAIRGLPPNTPVSEGTAGATGKRCRGTVSPVSQIGRIGRCVIRRLRSAPPVCLAMALGRLVTGRLRVFRSRDDGEFQLDDGMTFRPFRRIFDTRSTTGLSHCAFAVRFRFARFSQGMNRIASIIPMLLIAGFPGFRSKVYSVDTEDGHWLGLYEWETDAHLADYRSSLVYRMMKRRAYAGTLREFLPVENSIVELRTDLERRSAGAL